ncbi:hypothetical protein BOO92_19570 [Vibrio navarrensis]|nr:hypothetical protein [Vibrio navarrensis]
MGSLTSQIKKVLYQLKVGQDNPDLTSASLRLAMEEQSKLLELYHQENRTLDQEFNSLVDDYNQTSEQLENAMDRISSLEQVEHSSKTLLAKSSEAIRVLEKINATLKNKLIKSRTLQNELNELKSIKPYQLKTKNRKLKIEIDRLKKTCLDLKHKHIRNLDICGEGIELISQTGVKFCFIAYEYHQEFSSSFSDVKLLNDLAWFYQLRTSIGISIDAPCSEWGVPMWPYCSELEKHWHPDINKHMSALFVNRLEKTHPALTKRIAWAKGRALRTLPLTLKDQQALHNAGITSVFDVASRSAKYLQCNVAKHTTVDEQFAVRVKNVVARAVEVYDKHFHINTKCAA